MVRNIIGQLPLHPQYTFKIPSQALRTVISKDGLGVYASSDTLYRGAVFGRDSIEVAEDLIKIRPNLVKKIILTLASLQGEEYNEDNEEEPGKIVHEYRRAKVDGKPINDASAHIFNELSSRWGGNKKEMAYYGSVDSTPHFVRLVHKYCEFFGYEILNTKLTLRSGHTTSLAVVVENALTWIASALKTSESGLLEFKRKNPQGILNQVWKDSNEFFVHADGSEVNHNGPVSSIEAQGLAYDALLGGAKIFPHKKEEFEHNAIKLRDKTIDLLWIPKIEYFALGTDVSKTGQIRPINILTANPATLLESTFFDRIGSHQRRKYIKGVVREIMGDNFVTDAGIRSRARNEASLIPFWDYHGSYTSWPKETYDIAKGLRRHGFNRLAAQLENRIINTIRAMKSYPEFIYVDARGRVLGASTGSHRHGEIVFVDGSNKPEKIQAWTVSAVISIMSQKNTLTLPIPKILKKFEQAKEYSTWQREFEKEVMSHIPFVSLLKSKRELYARYPTYNYSLMNQGGTK